MPIYSDYSSSVMFKAGTEIDMKNSSAQNIRISQEYLVLGDRNSYLNETDITRAYRKFIKDFASALTNDTSWWIMIMFGHQQNKALAIKKRFEQHRTIYHLRRLYLSANIPLIETDTVTISELDYLHIVSQSTWMDSDSKNRAIEKAKAINEKIGYPNYLDGDNMTKLEQLYAEQNFNSSLMQNLLIVLKVNLKRRLQSLRQSVDCTEYNPSLNDILQYLHFSISFPAGILQPPFFHKDAPKYLSYGGIGTVMVHGITHGFDDTGRLFDKNGNKVSWWSNETTNPFNQRKECIIRQYNNYTVIQNTRENIADNGGLKEAFFAYQTWAQTHRNVDRKLARTNQYFTNQMKQGVHSPSQCRVNGPTSNFIEFDRVFSCKPNQGNSPTIGGIAGDERLTTCWKNTLLLNQTVNSLQPNDTLLIPFNRTFWLMGGIYARHLVHVTIQIDGILKFSDNYFEWPRDSHTHLVLDCFYFEQLNHVTFTSSNSGNQKGIIDGSGNRWWGLVEYLVIRGDRPRLLVIYNSTNLLIENILLKNSPKWTFYGKDIANLEIRHTDVDARRHPNVQWHDLDELTAFNTDGFDVSGINIWIHDCNIWNDDDCIAVKQQDSNSFHSSCSENMLFERINASGVGLTIGSIGPSTAHSCVHNITFRNCTMYNTFKGIYLKSRPGEEGHTGEISNILYENIQIYNASQWAIWLGPQQAAFKGACSLLWPFIPGMACPIPSGITWNNITLRNITLNDPQISPGVIIGNSSNPMKNILFDNVFVKNPGSRPWGKNYYACSNIEGIAQGNTEPSPPCFKHQIFQL
ncbi:hypothetical protein I4U23_004615 [Adineta vaga]|nr:hypothetical protein I4U23_004615 [Adineta vaga]